MSIKKAIIRSKDDLECFATKSYAHLPDLKIEEINLKELNAKSSKTDCERRMLSKEYKVENSEVAYRIYSSAGITLTQIRDIFDDSGFNVDIFFSEIHESDETIVTNVGGFILPFYRVLLKLMKKIAPVYELLFQYKLSPGNKRVHARIFHEQDNSWYITTHLDEVNVLKIWSPAGLTKSHFKSSQGNYKFGNKFMKLVLSEILTGFNNKERLSVDIDSIYDKLDNDKT